MGRTPYISGSILFCKAPIMQRTCMYISTMLNQLYIIASAIE
jgi:hypothetical protein